MRHIFNYMLLVMFLSMISNKILAYDIAVPNEDGVTIYYNRIGENELEVTNRWNVSGYNEAYQYADTINIPSQVTYDGHSYTVTRIGKSAFYGSEYHNKYPSFTSISIPSSIKFIDSSAFFCCKNLTSVYLSNGLVNIGEYAFFSCINLTSINLPNGLEYIGFAAFSGCKNLTSINLPVGLGCVYKDAFASCSKLEYVTISSTSPFGMYETAFDGCTNLKRIEYLSDEIVSPLFDISSLEIDGNSITSGIDTVVVSAKAYVHLAENSGWEKCNRIFARGEDSKLYLGIKNEYNNIVSVNGITNQTLVLVPYDQKAILKRTSSSPSELYVMMNGESSLLNVENPIMFVTPQPYNSFASNTVYVIDRNMSGTNDYTITISESGTLLSQIGRNNLENVKRLKIIGDINGTDVLVIRKMSSLEELDLSQANIVNGGSTNDYITSDNIIGDYFFKDLTNLIVLYLPESGTQIKSNVIDGCTKLQEIYIPGSFTHIGKNAFCNSGIKKVVFKESEKSIYVENYPFSNTSVSSLELYRNYYGSSFIIPTQTLRFLTIDGQSTKIDEYFSRYCTSLTTLIVGPMVKSIAENNFRDCKSLEYVIFRDSELSIELEEGDEQGFFGNSPIKSIYIGRNIKYIGKYNDDGVFMNLKKLSDLKISENVSKINNCLFFGCIGLQSVDLPNSIKTIGSKAFMGCKNISYIKMPNQLETIDSRAFKLCESLKNIDIASTVTDIGYGAFLGCSSLTSIKIGDNVKYIRAETFKDCTSLQYVRLGENTNSIGDDAFAYCTNIKTLYSWNPTPPAAGSTSLSGINRNTCTLYVPKGSGDLYWLHPEWGQFFEIKEVESENIRTTKMDDTTLNYYRIDGQQRMVPEKGINILRMSDGTTKKVYIK